ncbi:putative peptide modification system cyclase [Noviluteimonas gilva]|uniref:Putative peptide modification system cyclase n=1 Tax=Noviluteimonas gilva TaxID=2682097 RepID=A0A7C9HQC6_9GAMM|nr:putative peptide modification system cyclase [Lysobacter gilvus]MUV13051.1 putative peptide modification system cyclase [Lysobacter gilvus]
MNDFAQAGFDPASSPQVRTLLLTDLCDSTLLVERLGDKPAAELFRAHDRLVLDLQQRWRGRLIDRSDGLLLLFERPVDGLGFALDYTRGLRELGDRPEVRDRKLLLQARAGLHVGEVLTWQNSEAAVQAGAKPLEVEGLAKPLAGRLMTLARPGQILLSATAEPLARRAARELGDRSEHLIWKSHGRWRFKGVPDGQEVFEVGEPGFAPLRAPKQNGGKAWRDIPVWRRPTAVAAELFLVAGLATGAWFLARPTPAIAFNERDWVVVGDLRNLTGQPVLDESLEQAFRISLEQSRYVNVLSDLKVRDTLALMKRGPATTLDRETASEIAIRDGARAVILPTVAEVGGRVRVSAEVIDPHTQTTVYAESFDGVGAGSTLTSIDKVTSELREKLGEAVASIEQTSAPLPEVSTPNLDALKAYALGNRNRAKGNDRDALAFYEKSVELDPKFALGWLAIGQMHGKFGDLPATRSAMERANTLRDHLSAREKYLLDANLALFGPVAPLLQRWRQMIETYPDAHLAQFGLAQNGMFYANEYAVSIPHAKAAAVPQYERRAHAMFLLGMLQLGLEHYSDADRAFRDAEGSNPAFRTRMFDQIYPFAAQRQWKRVDEMMTQRKGSGVATDDIARPYNRMLFAIDRGDWKAAGEAAREASTLAGKAEPLVAGRAASLRSDALDALAGKASKDAMEKRLLARLADVRENAAALQAAYPKYDQLLSLQVGYLAARIDSASVLDRALAQIDGSGIAGYPPLTDMREALLAERDRLANKPALAVARLKPLAARAETSFPVHAALLRAARAADDTTTARAEARWIASHRGRAYVEMGLDYLPSMLNLADSNVALLEMAELSNADGNSADAAQSLQQFERAWPRATLPPSLAQRTEALSRDLQKAKGAGSH